MLQTKIAPLVLIAASVFTSAGCTPERAPHAIPPPGSALVVTTDYETGAYAAIDPSSYVAVSNIDIIHKDAICRADPTTGHVFIVSRLGADAIDIVDIYGTWDIATEYSVGAGTNPQDIAVVSASRAYVARYAESSLLVLNPFTGAQSGSVDLAAYADADGLPEAAWMLARGDKIYVALQKLVDAEVDGRSSILVIDATTGLVEKEIVLAGANMYGKLRYAAAVDRIPLIEVGAFGALDGGIQLLDPATDTVSAYIVTEQVLGGDLSDAVIASVTRGYAVIGVPNGNGQETHLVAFDPSTGAVGETLIESDGWHLGFLELTPDGDELWVAERNPKQPGVRVFDAATGTEILAAPIDVGLPPFMICFPETQRGKRPIL